MKPYNLQLRHKYIKIISISLRMQKIPIVKDFPPAVELGSSSYFLFLSIKIPNDVVASGWIIMISTDEASFNRNIKVFLPQCDLNEPRNKKRTD